MLLYLSCLVLVCFGVSEGRQQYIVGGEDVDVANFPWQGSLRRNGGHTCGCAFVGGAYALSAAHCGSAADGTYDLEFGTTVRGQGQIYQIASMTAHPDYVGGDGGNGVWEPNDLQIIMATSEISGTNISPATIAAQGSQPGPYGWITGWGATCGSCGLPDNLKGAYIDIISGEECDAINSWSDPFYHICVLDAEQLDGACFGDSGGPLVIDTTLYGITSWVTNGDCSPTGPSAYTRVPNYHDWVCANSGNLPQGC